MNNLKLFSFLFSILLVIQHTAWATGNQKTPSEAQGFTKALEHYRSLTREGKILVLKELIKQRPKADQAYAEKLFGDYSKLEFPEIRFAKDHVTLTYQQKTYSLKLHSDNQISFEGETIDLSPGKLALATEQIEAILTPKTSGVFDYVLNSAHAIDPFNVLKHPVSIAAGAIGFVLFATGAATGVGLLAVLGAIIAGLGFTISFLFYADLDLASSPRQVNPPLPSSSQRHINPCEMIQDQMRSIEDKVRSTLKGKIQDHMAFEKNCLALTEKYTSSAKETCQTLYTCLHESLAVSASPKGALDDSDRGNIKEIKPRNPFTRAREEVSHQ